MTYKEATYQFKSGLTYKESQALAKMYVDDLLTRGLSAEGMARIFEDTLARVIRDHKSEREFITALVSR